MVDASNGGGARRRWQPFPAWFVAFVFVLILVIALVVVFGPTREPAEIQRLRDENQVAQQHPGQLALYDKCLAACDKQYQGQQAQLDTCRRFCETRRPQGARRGTFRSTAEGRRDWDPSAPGEYERLMCIARASSACIHLEETPQFNECVDAICRRHLYTSD